MIQPVVCKRTAAFAGCVLGLCLGAFPSDLSGDGPQDRPKAGGQEATPAKPRVKERTLGVVLSPHFELLDVCGPVELFGNVGPRLKVVLVAQTAGPVASAQGPKLIADVGFDNCPDLDLILVPGGRGTLPQLGNKALLDWLRQRAAKAEIVMSVCTGSALLAKAGLLDGRRATS